MNIKKYQKIYVLDTNIILNDASNIIRLSQNNENLIVIPETVVNELDAKKSIMKGDNSDISFEAREFQRMLVDGKSTKTKIKKKTFETLYTLVDGQKILIVGLHKYKIDNLDPKVINDRKIIQVAKHMSTQHPKTRLISVDMMCRIYASIDGVKSEVLDYGKTDLKKEFVKEIELKEDDMELIIEGRDIKSIDPEYKPENYFYIFKNKQMDYQIEAYIDNNGQIQLVEKQDYVKADIKPKNTEQMFALKAMQDDKIDIVLIEAAAGSGKTLLAVHSAIKCVGNHKYDKIVYIRNSIESTDKGEDVGYLSGNKEKFEIYNFPLFDTLDTLVRTKNKKQKRELTETDISQKIEDMVEKYHIETMWVGAIRGRTISNAYVIIDEIQNFSRKSLQTVLSRLDESCKAVCIGSNRQIDNMYVNKYTNGFSLLLEQSKKEQTLVNMCATELNKIYRGRITEWAEEVFTK